MPPINLLIKPASGRCNMRCRYCFYADETARREVKDYGIMQEDTLEALVKKVRTVDGGASAEPVAVVSRSEGGRVEQFQVGGATVTGRQIRELLGLRSANFTVQMITDSNGGRQVLFTTSGNGHGVGMSQYGADGMGKAGFDYKEILQHYYSGVEVR